MKHDHKVVAGPPKSQLTPSEAKEVAIKNAIALAAHKVLPPVACLAMCNAARLVPAFTCPHPRAYIHVLRLVCLHARIYILVATFLSYFMSTVVPDVNGSVGASVTGHARTRQARLCLVERGSAVGVFRDSTRKRS